jgi:hypothetical protein
VPLLRESQYEMLKEKMNKSTLLLMVEGNMMVPLKNHMDMIVNNHE